MTDEKENMWRTLKGEEHLIPFKCRWGFHRWTKWKLHSMGKTLDFCGTPLAYRRRYVYEAKCMRCEKFKRKQELHHEDQVRP